MEINLTYKQVNPVFEYMGSKFIYFEYCVSIFETNNLPQDSGNLLNCPLFAGDSVTDPIICHKPPSIIYQWLGWGNIS